MRIRTRASGSACDTTYPSVFAFGAENYAPEQLTPGHRVLYLHPGGIGRNRLAADLAKAKAKRPADVEMAVRNWRTLTKLLEIAQG